MFNSESKAPLLDYILKRISDKKTLALFNSIAISEGDRSAKLRKVSMTSKQYYIRISGLTDAGLIKRHKGKYSLTLLGKVVYDSQMIIGKVLSHYSKLRTIESIKMSYSGEIPKEELSRLINALIDSYQVKDMIMESISADFTRGY
jgi:predicted transcriptional regulator